MGGCVKKVLLFLSLGASLALVASATTVPTSDIITFSFIELAAPAINFTSSPSGVAAGPALNIVVSDTLHHAQFPLSGFFSASTGPGVISVTPDRYEGEFALGGAVAIVSGATTFVSGAPMFGHSHFISNLSEDVGAFAGEFHVTSVDPSVFARFGLPDAWKPDASVSVTTGHNFVVGEDLTGIIGGGTVTIETPAPVPEASTWFLFLFGAGTLLAFNHARRRT
jgi:hypothetical protein